MLPLSWFSGSRSLNMDFLTRKNINPNSAFKWGLGLLFSGLVFGISCFNLRHKWIGNTTYFLFSRGILYLHGWIITIIPTWFIKNDWIITKKIVAFIMGVWFLSSFFGHFFAGKIAVLASGVATDNFMSDGIFETIIQSITGLTAATASNFGLNFVQLFKDLSVYVGFGLAVIIARILALLI